MSSNTSKSAPLYASIAVGRIEKKQSKGRPMILSGTGTEMKDNKFDLLPCPFCGGEARLVDLQDHYDVAWDCRYFVECSNYTCPVRSSTRRHARQDAVVKRWNTREGD